jgi:protein-L-isoaspartate(D-aspartate) O-methyltransferase
MNIEQARFNMIEQQIRPWNVLELDVLELLTVVKREEFVAPQHKALAFVDTEIPLPNGEAMLSPKIEARILQEVGLKKHENVLEIGTGSGYMAALLAYKGRHVTTIEIDADIRRFAEQNLAAYGIANVTVVDGDGAQGWAPADSEPFDVIVISGGLPYLPEAFLQQVKIGGRIACFVGEAPVMSAEIVTRTSATEFSTRKVFETSIKHLRSAARPSQFKF